jgi:hypothetical protein
MYEAGPGLVFSIDEDEHSAWLGTFQEAECQLAEGNTREERTASQEPSETETLTSKPNEDLPERLPLPLRVVSVNPAVCGRFVGKQETTAHRVRDPSRNRIPRFETGCCKNQGVLERL